MLRISEPTKEFKRFITVEKNETYLTLSVTSEKELASDCGPDEAKMEFFNYTKNNLSVCIEELIRDEEFISEK